MVAAEDEFRFACSAASIGASNSSARQGANQDYCALQPELVGSKSRVAAEEVGRQPEIKTG